jgi:hypothetical protein
MPRTVIENGVTFRIDSEIGWTADTDASVEATQALLSYITTTVGMEGDEVPAFRLTSPRLIFSGAVTPTAGDPEEIAKWQLGIVQNVTAYQRMATYANGWSITEAFQTGAPPWNPAPPPLRDGTFGGIPFSHGGAALEPNQQTEVDPQQSQDDPTWELPQVIQVMEDGSALASTSGNHQFATWLMLARMVAPPEERKIILLGRIRWRVDWTTVMQGGAPVFPGSVTEVLELTTGLAQVYTAANLPALGDGTTVPDLRTNVEGNMYIVGILNHPGEVRKWRYDADGGAVELEQAENPNASPNWLLEQQLHAVWLESPQRVGSGPAASVRDADPDPEAPAERAASENATPSGEGTVFDLEVAANVLRVDTGLVVDGALPVSLRTKSGSWTANPATGMVGPTGHPDLIAKPGYSLPSALEGLLVGQVGTAVFPIGDGAAVPAGATGRLYLSINDDTTDEYGAGFTDNEGSMLVEIAVGSRGASAEAPAVQRGIENATYDTKNAANAALAKAFFAAYEAAAQKAYAFAVSVPSLGAYAALDGRTELWVKKWQEHLTGGTPKLMAAAFGYVIESLVSDSRSEFCPKAPDGCSVLPQVTSGGTRPDLVLALKSGSAQVAWLDLTASDSADHIFAKEGWAKKIDNFAEVTYPSLDLATLALMKQNKDNKGTLSPEEFEKRKAAAQAEYLRLKQHWRTVGQKFTITALKDELRANGLSKEMIGLDPTRGQDFIREKLNKEFSTTLDNKLVPSILEAMGVGAGPWGYLTGTSQSEKAGEAWLIDNSPLPSTDTSVGDSGSKM